MSTGGHLSRQRQWYALKSYNDFVAKLKLVYGEKIGAEKRRTSAYSENQYYSFQPNQTIEVEVKISFSKQISTGSYNVELTIMAPKTVINITEVPVKPAREIVIVKTDDADYKTISREILDNLVQTKYEAIRTHFNAEMRQLLTAEKLAAGWAEMIQRAGSFQRSGGAILGKEQGADAVFIRCEMERASVMLVVIFGKEGLVNGLWLRPM